MASIELCWESDMRASSIVCASIVALALTANGASAMRKSGGDPHMNLQPRGGCTMSTIGSATGGAGSGKSTIGSATGGAGSGRTMAFSTGGSVSTMSDVHSCGGGNANQLPAVHPMTVRPQ